LYSEGSAALALHVPFDVVGQLVLKQPMGLAVTSYPSSDAIKIFPLVLFVVRNLKHRKCFTVLQRDRSPLAAALRDCGGKFPMSPINKDSKYLIRCRSFMDSYELSIKMGVLYRDVGYFLFKVEIKSCYHTVSLLPHQID